MSMGKMAITGSTVAVPASIRLIGEVSGASSRSHADGGRAQPQQLGQQKVEADVAGEPPTDFLRARVIPRPYVVS